MSDPETAIARADRSLYWRKRTKLIRRVRVKKGLCIQCEEPTKRGVRCEAHAAKHRLAQRLRYKPKFEHLDREP